MLLRFLFIFTLVYSLQADTLNDFSTAADTDTSSDLSSSSKKSSNSGSGFSNIFVGILTVSAKVAFQVPFENSIERVTIAGSEKHLLNKYLLKNDKAHAVSYLRENGEIMLPYVRADLAYSSLEGGIQSVDYSAELGFGPIAVYARQSYYKDYDLDESLRIDQLYGLFRLTYIKEIEVDFGFGQYKIDGINTNKAFAFTLPIIIHPTDNFGIELRPVWSKINANTIRDHTLDLLYDWKYISIKTGYRWQKVGNKRLNGAHIGLVFHY